LNFSLWIDLQNYLLQSLQKISEHHCKKISIAFVRGDVLKQSALLIATFLKFKK
jgi:hypothetical protein